MTEADYEKMSAFSCGVPELDKFFHSEIKECVNHHYLAAYCAYTDSGEIVAAFTLMNDSLMISDASEKEDFIEDLKLETSEEIVDFFDLQSSYPALNIGHLGTKNEWKNHGIGASIIDLVATTYAGFRNAGCQFITVDALNNPEIILFYQHNQFSLQTLKDSYSPTRRMYRIL